MKRTWSYLSYTSRLKARNCPAWSFNICRDYSRSESPYYITIQIYKIVKCTRIIFILLFYFMALWHKLKRFASNAKAKTRSAIRKISNSRPIILRSIFAKNFATIIRSLFYKRDKLKPALSKQTQMIAEMQIPRLFRKPIYSTYSKFYKVIVKEIELPMADYPTFSSFFTRKIVRPLPDYTPNTVCSPCDGKVLVVEEVTGDKCHIIKNASYSLSQLVSGSCQQHNPSYISQNLQLRKGSKLFQLVIYLAPGDYHRFHSPVDLKILKKKEIEGNCDSVSERVIARGKPIYQKNGRVTVTGEWAQGLLTMVMVGALNVTRIHITEQKQLERGQELGYFNLGSTIVMIVETDDVLEWQVQPGEKIKYGEPLFLYKPAK